jgi:dihydrofolate synthase/folylpolyglutamate synthase
MAIAGEVLGRVDPGRARAVAEGLELRGRMEVHRADPPEILDAAHNPDGARALAEALGEAADSAPIVACLALLADKDAAAMMRELAPRIVLCVATELPAERLARAGRPGARSLEAARLAQLAEAAGVDAEAIQDPRTALARARELARERRGMTLISGSHYLLGYA